MPVWIADRKVYVNTRGTQTVKICTARNQQGQYERYYRIPEEYALTQRDMEDRVARCRTIPDLEGWLVSDRQARRERENESAPPPPRCPHSVADPDDLLLVGDREALPDDEEGLAGEPESIDVPAFLETSDRREAIERFIAWCGRPYVDYFDLTQGRADEIENHYFARLRTLPEPAVFQVLGIMIAWILHQTEAAERRQKHIPVEEWKGCCTGVADLLLRPRAVDGGDRIAAASALQRLSGWYHTGIPLWHAFRRPARLLGDILCGPGVLHYLKIGEEWSPAATRLDPSLIHAGDMLLWHFAEGAPNPVRRERKRPDETRTLASRLLNYLCSEGYRVRAFEDEYAYLLSLFPGPDPWVLPSKGRDRDNHPLLRWSVEKEFVDLLTRRMIIRPADLLPFLARTGFNPDVTYKPVAETRLEWFRRWECLARPQTQPGFSQDPGRLP